MLSIEETGIPARLLQSGLHFRAPAPLPTLEAVVACLAAASGSRGAAAGHRPDASGQLAPLPRLALPVVGTHGRADRRVDGQPCPELARVGTDQLPTCAGQRQLNARTAQPGVGVCGRRGGGSARSSYADD